MQNYRFFILRQSGCTNLIARDRYWRSEHTNLMYVVNQLDDSRQLAVPQSLRDIIKKLTVEERIKSDTGLKYLSR